MIEEELLNIIRNLADDPILCIDLDTNLIDEGIVDSIFIMQIVTEIEDKYGIEIDGDDIDPENFETVYNLIEMVKRYIG